MLEFFGIMMLCKANKKLALARGRKPGGYIALTIILWVGLEFIGAIVGTVLELDYGRIFLAYGFAGIGALISFLCAKFGPKGDYVDPNTVPAGGSADTNVPYMGTYNVPVDQSLYAPYPNAPADQYGMPVASKLNEFGMPVDENGNYSPVLNQYGVPVDTTLYNVQNPVPAQAAPVAVTAAEAAATSHPNFCGYCGAKLEPGSKFCDSCGAKIGS